MIKKKLFISLLLISLLGVCSASSENATTEMVKLRLIKDNGDTEIMKVNAKTESIALSETKVIRIVGLENLPNLSELSLPFFSINSLDWIPKKIKKLNLHGNKIESLEGIEDFIVLEEVYLDANRISNIDAVFKNNTIKEASFSSNKKIEIVICSDNDSIELLDLTDNNIKHIYNLEKLSNLKYLYLQANPIENNIEEINKLREKNPKVKIIVGSQVN